MRFLMNSPVALTSTAVDSCVPTKLSLDALGLSCSRVLGASLAPILRGYWREQKAQRSAFRRDISWADVNRGFIVG